MDGITMTKRTKMRTYKDVVMGVISEMVDRPDLLVIDERRAGRVTVLAVTPDPSDAGKLIGQEGKFHKAMESLLFCLACRRGEQIHYTLVVPPKKEVSNV
jgi:predicted RNA-binding protein YlqC (UPF0109 family)